MREENLIRKCQLLILSIVLLMALIFGITSLDKMSVSAEGQYRVNFDYNIDVLSDNMVYDRNGVMLESVENKSITIDAGYIINASQYNPSNLFNPYYHYEWTCNGQTVNIDTLEISGDTTLVVKWTPVKYYVNFFFENDDMKSKVTNLVERIEFSIESPQIELYKPDIPNYHFDGWYNGAVHYDLMYLPSGSTGSKNFTARFSPKLYSINYHTESDNPKYYDVTYENIILAEPSKEGHIFLGWYSDNEYRNQVDIIDCSIGGNINLYPLWSLKTYTVTYILPDGYGRKIEVEYGKKAELPDIKKSIFEIIVTDVSRKNITENTTIRIKLVNIWYVYLIGLIVIVGVIFAIVYLYKKREKLHNNLRDKYHIKSGNRTKASVSIIEKRPVSLTKTTNSKSKYIYNQNTTKKQPVSNSKNKTSTTKSYKK